MLSAFALRNHHVEEDTLLHLRTGLPLGCIRSSTPHAGFDAHDARETLSCRCSYNARPLVPFTAPLFGPDCAQWQERFFGLISLMRSLTAIHRHFGRRSWTAKSSRCFVGASRRPLKRGLALDRRSKQRTDLCGHLVDRGGVHGTQCSKQPAEKAVIRSVSLSPGARYVSRTALAPLVMIRSDAFRVRFWRV